MVGGLGAIGAAGAVAAVNAVSTLLNVALTPLPSKVTEEMMTTAISDASIAYSIEVTPRRSVQNGTIFM
ncbi:hypothetical protein GCM10010909_09900 [Acidocella aquatica]|uniref:Uncharacterized protein n=1 Tax=Acidocella aquatica TaxID=1922313 RepID=A0ABQ6A1I7_9PROT|nr:hypothetical protein GCM10010909_09900 [Acidocella aquatica]